MYTGPGSRRSLKTALPPRTHCLQGGSTALSLHFGPPTSRHFFVRSPAYAVHLETYSEISSSGQVPGTPILVRMLVPSGALQLSEGNGRSDSESLACLVEAPQKSSMVRPSQIKLKLPRGTFWAENLLRVLHRDVRSNLPCGLCLTEGATSEQHRVLVQTEGGTFICAPFTVEPFQA